MPAKSDVSAAEGAAAANRARNRYSLGKVAEHVALAAAEVGKRFHIGTILGVGERSTPDSDHPKGLALDYMCSGTRGARLRDFVIANRARLGVSYVIFQQRIYDDRTHWKADMMEDRGSTTANHYDHVHVSFNSTPGKGGAVISPTSPAAAAGGGAGGTSVVELQDTMQKVAVTGMFIVGGAALVVLGLGKTAAPAVKAATETVTDAATKAASVAGPEGKAAATALSATKGKK